MTNAFGRLAFLIESNAIEGIHRDPYDVEIDAFRDFLSLPALTVADLNDLQFRFAPNMPLRDKIGLNVRVGNHIAPAGGPEIAVHLANMLAEMPDSDPWKTHVAFETLHPYCDGNGRTGRALWAWHMQAIGRDPFALSFLHRFYYQTLEHVGR